MAKTIMIQATSSDAGKSLITAGLGRVLVQDGYNVAPFKAQNMALNSYITDDLLEMGRAQAVQAKACKVKPEVSMNPILLKPSYDNNSQIILHGEVFHDTDASSYFDKTAFFKTEVKKAFDNLSEKYDVIVIEGAGSASEINLRNVDVVNMGMAKLVDAPVFIVADIDKGGIFGSIVGTMALFDEEERKLVKGVIINKFRGDISLLDDGIKMLEDIIKVPVVGVIPYLDVDIDEEDGLSNKKFKEGFDDMLDIAVIKFPRISNFTDFDPFENIDNVGLRYVSKASQFHNPDMLILPGTKNTIQDLKWLEESGLKDYVLRFARAGKPIFGICGGYQMLGMKISDPECIESGESIEALGLLPHETVFFDEKIRRKQSLKLATVDGIFKDLSDMIASGYEIHMGKSFIDKAEPNNIINKGNVYGTYLHGFFDEKDIVLTIISALAKQKGLDEVDFKFKFDDLRSYNDKEYDKLADSIREHLNMELIYDLLK